MKTLLIGNPASGGAAKHDRDLILDALSKLGSVDRIEPSSAEAFGAEVRAAAAGQDLIVSAGGDGTFNCTINALYDELDAVALALIPMGTGNDLARTLGLPSEPVEAAAVLVEATERPLDIAMASGAGAERFFANACMGGFPVQVNEAIDEDEKERLGAAAFIWGGAKALSRLERSTVTIGGVRLDDCVAVGVGNGRTCGGGIEVWPDADPGDGVLEGCALGAVGPADLIKLATKLKFGDHRELESVVTAGGSQVAIDAAPAIELNVDGELIGLRTPARFEVVKQARVLVPTGP